MGCLCQCHNNVLIVAYYCLNASSLVVVSSMASCQCLSKPDEAENMLSRTESGDRNLKLRRLLPHCRLEAIALRFSLITCHRMPDVSVSNHVRSVCCPSTFTQCKRSASSSLRNVRSCARALRMWWVGLGTFSLTFS